MPAMFPFSDKEAPNLVYPDQRQKHESSKHMYLQVFIPITPSAKKFMDLLHEFKYIYKPRYINVLVSQHES
jgi:hypothetical protein